MRKEILTKIHASHQGREKCKQQASQVVFWTGINSDINNVVGQVPAPPAQLPKRAVEAISSSNPSMASGWYRSLRN